MINILKFHIFLNNICIDVQHLKSKHLQDKIDIESLTSVNISSNSNLVHRKENNKMEKSNDPLPLLLPPPPPTTTGSVNNKINRHLASEASSSSDEESLASDDSDLQLVIFFSYFIYLLRLLYTQ